MSEMTRESPAARVRRYIEELVPRLAPGELQLRFGAPAPVEVVREQRGRVPDEWIELHSEYDGVEFSWDPAEYDPSALISPAKRLHIPPLGQSEWLPARQGPPNSYLLVDDQGSGVGVYYERGPGANPQRVALVVTESELLSLRAEYLCGTLEQFVDLAIRYELRRDWADEHAHRVTGQLSADSPYRRPRPPGPR